MEKHRADKVDLLVAYSEVGGVAGALAQKAERVRTKLDKDGRGALLPGIFVRLVRLGETGGATRRMAEFSDFDDRRRALAAELASEEKGRLLLAGETSVEIAHEALITQWPWLQDTLNAAASDMRVLDRLIDRTRRCSTLRPEHHATGAEREEFSALATQHPEWLAELEREFIAASNRAHVRAVQICTAGIAALATAVVLLVVATGIALYNMNVAREQREIATGAEQESRRAAQLAERDRDHALLAQSRLLADLANQHRRRGDAGTAMLLALEALPDQDSGSVRPLAHEAETALSGRTEELRETQVLAHKRPLWSASFRPHSGVLVTASEDGKAYLWDKTGTERITLDEHTDPVRLALFSPNGEHLIVASTDAHLWTIGGERRRTILKHGTRIWSAQFSPDSRLVATASGSSAHVWDVLSGKQVWLLDGHDGLVRVVAFDPAGRRVLTGSDDRTARLWNMETGKLVRVFEGHDEVVRGAAFSVDGRRAITTSEDRTARLWDLHGSEAPIVLRGHEALVWSAAFSPDGRLVVTASEDKTARVWNAETGEPLRILDGHELPVLSAAFGHDSRSIVTASADKTARVWEAASGNVTAVLRGYLARVESVTLTADGAQVLTASNDGTARVWTVQPVASERTVVLDARTPVRSAKFIGDGRELLTAEKDGTVRLWDAQNGRSVGSSRDGRLTVTPLSSDTREVNDAATGTSLAVLKLQAHGPRLMRERDDDAARFWNTAWGVPPVVNPFVFAVSGDGKRIVQGGTDEKGFEKAFVHNVETGALVATLHGHEHSIFDVAFSRDGARIVTAAGDGTARIWDAGTGQTVAVLEHATDVWSASFSPDGERVVTATVDGTTRIWKVFPTMQALVGRAKAIVPRCLTPDQRLAAFLPETPPVWCVQEKKWPFQGGE